MADIERTRIHLVLELNRAKRPGLELDVQTVAGELASRFDARVIRTVEETQYQDKSFFGRVMDWLGVPKSDYKEI